MYSQTLSHLDVGSKHFFTLHKDLLLLYGYISLFHIMVLVPVFLYYGLLDQFTILADDYLPVFLSVFLNIGFDICSLMALCLFHPIVSFFSLKLSKHCEIKY